jgi:hypothetical protein
MKMSCGRTLAFKRMMMMYVITPASGSSCRTTSWSSAAERRKIVHGDHNILSPSFFYSLLASGCLPLVLAFTNSVLRELRYPLLPHQTVHKSLCQLIVIAASISMQYSAMIKSVPVQRSSLQAYINRIGISLALAGNSSHFFPSPRYESGRSNRIFVEEDRRESRPPCVLSLR